MTFFRKIAALSFLALEAYPSAAFALPMAFAGSWSNVNPAARGLSRVTVDNSTNGRIRLLGACHP